jgi:hypothetical protein
LELLTPSAIRHDRTEQSFDTRAGRLPDPFEAVRAAATLVTAELLDPARLNRVAWQHAVDPAMPGVRDVVEAVLPPTWPGDSDTGSAEVPGGAGVLRTAGWTVLNHLLTVLDGPGLHAPVRADLRAVLREFTARLRVWDGEERAAAETIEAYLTDPRSVRLDPLPRVPPGEPN